MAKITLLDAPQVPSSFNDLDEVVIFLGSLINSISSSLGDIEEEINGKLEIINRFEEVVTVADTGTANTDFALNHNLGRTDVYYEPNINSTSIAGAVTFYKGATSWTSNIAYLRCNQANLNVTFIVKA